MNKDELISKLNQLGYDEIKCISNTRFAVLVEDSSHRIPALETIEREFSLMGYGAIYNRIDYRLSSIGHVTVNKTFLIGAKPKKRQGNQSAGIQNEQTLVTAIQHALTASNSHIEVHFIGENQTMKLDKIKHVYECGRDTTNGKKSDINLVSLDNSEIPISLKKSNAEMWESADSYWGNIARSYIDKAIANTNAELKMINGVNRIIPNIAISANDDEELKVVFGEDISANNGAVIVKTFTNADFDFDIVSRQLNISVEKIYKTLEDFRKHDKIWFLIRNDSTRTSKQIGYSGIRVLAVSEKRINSKVARIDR